SEEGVTVIELPAAVSTLQAPIAFAVPLQLLAYHVAVLKGTDVDQPRNLAKSLTVEQRAPSSASIKTTPRVFFARAKIYQCRFTGRKVMKWAGMYFVGFAILVGGVLAALWKLGVLARIGTTWTLIGLAILLGLGIMIAVTNSGKKESIQIDRK